jgi:hypothetical protein
VDTRERGLRSQPVPRFTFVTYDTIASSVEMRYRGNWVSEYLGVATKLLATPTRTRW